MLKAQTTGPNTAGLCFQRHRHEQCTAGGTETHVPSGGGVALRRGFVTLAANVAASVWSACIGFACWQETKRQTTRASMVQTLRQTLPKSSKSGCPTKLSQISRVAYQISCFQLICIFFLGFVWVGCGLATSYQGPIPDLGLVGPLVVGPLGAV